MRRYTALIVLLSCVLRPPSLHADEIFPRKEWKDTANPLADLNAYPGGSISTFAGQYPNSFNYYLANNTFCAELFSSMYETLLDTDPLTADYTPGVAKKWSISDDKLTFTFWIDERAQWSDGVPITAHDVLWTVGAILNPTNLTGPHKISLERFLPPQIIDERTIRFTAKEVHWKSLGAAGGFPILPRHAYEHLDFNKINFEFPVVSGPYHLGRTEEGARTELVRRDDWWRINHPRHQNTGNFSTIAYRFFSKRENAFEEFKKGLIDIYPVHTSRLWVNEACGPKFTMNWIVKQKVQNYRPLGFQGFAMNTRRRPFDDLRVRKAMAHLLNRNLMNRTLMYSQYFMHRSYFEDLYSKEIPCTNPTYDYDPDKAAELLTEAGWGVNPDTGLREKDGLPLTITFLARDTSAEKFLQIYNEDLKDAGVTLKVENKDWASWAKDMETFNYGMTWAAWSASIFKDPESMWSSDEADRPNGNNITGFKDGEVDKLIERQKTIFDVAERHAICRTIDRIVSEQCPYALLWNINYSRLLYWNTFGTPPTVLSKYGDASSAHAYWWYDEDSSADLQDAKDARLPLPSRSATVMFDSAFHPRTMRTPGSF